jgi:fibronectin type 3 domain-containing protein
MLYLFVGVAATGSAVAQEQAADLIAVRGEGGSVFVYVLAELRMTESVNLYRVDGDGEHLLTPAPLKATSDPAALLQALGPRYDELASDLGTGSPMETLLRLSGDDALGVLTSVSDSTVGRLLGRLFIDREAPADESLYRANILGGLEQPTGRVFESTTANPAPQPPADVSGSALGSRVTLRWSYDATGQFDDFVIRFYVDEVGVDGQPLRRLTEGGLFRVSTQDDYTYSFDAPGIGRTYRFQVSAVTAGWEVVPSDPIAVEVVDNIPPSRVTTLVARALADTAVVLSWQPPESDPDAEYSIRKAPRLSGPFQEIARTATSGFDAWVDRDLVPRSTYHYSVIAIDSVGNASAPGDVANAYVPDLTPPPAPSGVEASASDGAVSLSWSGEMPADFNTFVVMRRRLAATGTPDPYSQANIDPVRSLRFDDDGPADVGFVEGSYYEYAVVAADSAANFSDSVFVVVKVPDETPPNPPTALTVRTEYRRVSLAWAASTSRDVVSYHVYRSDDGSESLLDVLGADNRSVRDALVPPGVRIQYRVEARDSSGNAASAVTEPFMQGDTAAPAPPRNVQASHDDGRALIRWTGSHAVDLSGYLVERADYAGAAFVQIGETESPEWSDAEGRPGHVYRVVAIDEAGNRSAPSATAIAN